jgi:hypothetical protein
MSLQPAQHQLFIGVAVAKVGRLCRRICRRIAPTIRKLAGGQSVLLPSSHRRRLTQLAAAA